MPFLEHSRMSSPAAEAEAVVAATLAPMVEEELKVGFIGAGNLAACIVGGLVNSGTVDASRIRTAHRDPESRLRFLQLGVRVYHHNHEVVEECDVIIFSVKPQILKEVILELRPLLSEKKLIVSLAAGHTLKNMQEWIGHGRIIRVVTNTASVVGSAVIIMHLGETATQEDGGLIAGIFGAIGKVWILDEKLSDAAGAIGGCGLAFMYIAMEAMADGGVAAGLPREIAKDLASQAVLGAAMMAIKTGKHLGQLKDEVASPGGMTIAGIHELERGSFRGSLMNAVVVTTKRGRELGTD